MKKLSKSSFLHFICCLSVCLFLTSCCRGADCGDDMVVPEKADQLFSFQPGDQVRYLSNVGDTLTFNCSKREIINLKWPQLGDIEQECCDAIDVEELHLSFETNNGDTLFVKTLYETRYSLSCILNLKSSKLNGYWPDQFSKYPDLEPLDSIQLAGIPFFNVYQARNDVKIYLEPDSLGIVGFVIDGKEWRLL